MTQSNVVFNGLTEKQLTVLVVDDGEMNRRMLARFFQNIGHTCVTAGNGVEAVAYCESHIPDVILMDVMMPIMDGYEATIAIRKLLGETWVPIIFLSGLDEHDSLIKGLEVGGDDYLTKPLDFTLLMAKLNVMRRIAEMQDRIRKYLYKLDTYYQENEEEQRLAQHVLNRFNTQPTQGASTSNIAQWLKPAVNFSGDVISVARTPTGVDHVLLADSTGHGLAAAISCLPAVSTFFAMTQRGFGVNTIAREMNKKLNTVLPVGRFVAAAIISIDYRERIVAVWNGGIPCAFFMNREGQIDKEFKSSFPPLGILSDAMFQSNLDVFRWEKEGEVIACSDGLTEAYSEENIPFENEGVIAAARAAQSKDTAGAITRAVTAHLGQNANHDDVSLVTIDCQASYGIQAEPDEKAQKPTAIQTSLANWEVRLHFETKDLREKDCFQILVGWLNLLGLSPKQMGDVLLISTELFNNALDHGVLGLSSKLKTVEDGFMQFMMQRLERLSALAQGDIEVGLGRGNVGDQAILRLWIRDSGKGFDYTQLDLDHISDDTSQAHGRGLAMIKAICKTLAFNEVGNQVSIEYVL